MSAVELPGALPWISLLATWLVLAVAVTASYRILRPALQPIEPQQRSTALLALAALPLTVAVLVTVLGFAPAIGGLIVDPHCHAGTGCRPHVPTLQSVGGRQVLPIALLLGSSVAAVLWLIVGRLRRSLLAARALKRVAEPEARRAYRTIETENRIACCVGLLRPQLLVSRGLVDALPVAQLDVVLAHEEAHASRFDNLRNLIASISLRPIPPFLRDPLLSDFRQATEEACDAAAARTAGGPELVIETLKAMTNASGRRSRLHTSFAHSAVDLRITALELRSSTFLPRRTTAAMALSVYGVAAVAATEAAHHGAELALTWLG